MNTKYTLHKSSPECLYIQEAETHNAQGHQKL